MSRNDFAPVVGALVGVSAMAALASSRLAMRLVLLLGLLGCAFAGKGVTLATDRTFDDVVLNSGKNAFVKFLAPW